LKGNLSQDFNLQSRQSSYIATVVFVVILILSISRDIWHYCLYFLNYQVTMSNTPHTSFNTYTLLSCKNLLKLKSESWPPSVIKIKYYVGILLTNILLIFLFTLKNNRWHSINYLNSGIQYCRLKVCNKSCHWKVS
jgi:hypothetical protein